MDVEPSLTTINEIDTFERDLEQRIRKIKIVYVRDEICEFQGITERTARRTD